jgi:hypothetical protein
LIAKWRGKKRQPYSAGALDNAKFAKCCNDSSLINRKFTSTDADIIFSKVKAKAGGLYKLNSVGP